MVRKLYPFNWSPLFTLFMRTGAEKTGLQTPNDFDAVAVKGLKSAQWINGQVQRVHVIQEGVPNYANNVNDVRNTIQGIRALSEHGADRNATNNVRHTFLHTAASHGKLAAVRLLVEHGADVRVKNGRRGRGPWKFRHLLLEHGADVHVQNNNNGGWAPLHEAASEGYPDIMRLLFEHGADLKATTYDGSTPLHVAASYGKPDRAHVVRPRGAQEPPISIVPRRDDWHHRCRIERRPATPVMVGHKFEHAVSKINPAIKRY
jgi:hypothetical protein